MLLSLLILVILNVVYGAYENSNLRSEGSISISITFSVKQRNLDILEKTLFEVSDPKSEKYGKYLTRDEGMLSLILTFKYYYHLYSR